MGCAEQGHLRRMGHGLISCSVQVDLRRTRPLAPNSPFSASGMRWTGTLIGKKQFQFVN
jgi:hypothetical protein